MDIIVVVGSINVDVVSRVTEYPVPGQTIKSESTEFHYGGKGANQAVAAARSGGPVAMVGAVGTDPFGSELVGSLQSYGVDTSRVISKPGASGMAFIMVDAAGQNQIILSEGANAALKPEDVERAGMIDSAAVLLLQNEIPWETNLSVMLQAKAKGLQVCFNPAPAVRIPEDVLPLIDTLILNESETEFITGQPIGSRDDAILAAHQLLGGGVREVIITMGAQGSLYMGGNGNSIYTPALPVKAVDTTSAGDTFIGYYAAQRCSGKPVEEALRYASAAAALCVTREGAQSSIPGYEEVERFITLNNGEL